MTIQRSAYLRTIRARLRDNPIVSLLGPRQAGKTTIARMLADESDAPVHFFDLESPVDLARLANPELVLRPLTGLVILDEIQRRPELLPLLRVLADRPGTPARFVILGSASPVLVQAGSETLAGRVSFVDVTGFTLAELGDDALTRLWWRGGFPRALLAPDDAVARQWLDDFRRTFLERDVPQLGIQVPAATLGRFWTMVAHYHGQVLNVAELARALGSSEPTARRYLDILSGTFVVRQLPPWFENLKKRQLRSPKVYVRDSGLLHALLGIVDSPGLQSHPKLGASWEGFCLEQTSAFPAIALPTSGGRTVVPRPICCCSMPDVGSGSSSSTRRRPVRRSRCASHRRTWGSITSTSFTPASTSSRWTKPSRPFHSRASCECSARALVRTEGCGFERVRSRRTVRPSSGTLRGAVARKSPRAFLRTGRPPHPIRANGIRRGDLMNPLAVLAMLAFECSRAASRRSA